MRKICPSEETFSNSVDPDETARNRINTVDKCFLFCNQSTDVLDSRLSLSVGRENGPEEGFKTVLFKHELPVIYTNSADPDQTPRSVVSEERGV